MCISVAREQFGDSMLNLSFLFKALQHLPDEHLHFSMSQNAIGKHLYTNPQEKNYNQDISTNSLLSLDYVIT